MANEAPALLTFVLFWRPNARSRRQTAEFWRGAGYVVARPLIQVKEPGGSWSINGRVEIVAGVLLLATAIRIAFLSTTWNWIGGFFESFKVLTAEPPT